MARPREMADPALAGELLGASIIVQRAPGVAKLPLRGTIVDESMNLFFIREPGKPRARKIPKSGLEATVFLGERELPLKGESVRVRPEDRTKRLLRGGRPRLR